MVDRSSGIGVSFTHVPLAYAKKSSPGCTAVSIDAGMMPGSWTGADRADSWFVLLQAPLKRASARAAKAKRFRREVGQGFITRILAMRPIAQLRKSVHSSFSARRRNSSGTERPPRDGDP